jgi:predicted ester cyclase
MVVVNKTIIFKELKFELSSILYEGQKIIRRGEFHCRWKGRIYEVETIDFRGALILSRYVTPLRCTE